MLLELVRKISLVLFHLFLPLFDFLVVWIPTYFCDNCNHVIPYFWFIVEEIPVGLDDRLEATVEFAFLKAQDKNIDSRTIYFHLILHVIQDLLVVSFCILEPWEIDQVYFIIFTWANVWKIFDSAINSDLSRLRCQLPCRCLNAQLLLSHRVHQGCFARSCYTYKP